MVPAPPDHITPEATVLVAAIVAVGASAHTFTGLTGVIVGAGVNVMVAVPDTMLQFPLPVDCKVKFRVPALISAAVGVYVGFSTFLPGVNVPAPPTHVPPDATVTEPFKLTVALLEHTEYVPAVTTGVGVKVIVVVLDTGAQLPLFIVLRVNVTVPAARSLGPAV